MGRVIVAALAFGALTASASLRPADAALLLGTNLVVNGGAELVGGTDSDITSWRHVPGGGSVEASRYGARPAFPTLTDPGPADRGVRLFTGGVSNLFSSIDQALSVVDGASAIDAGAVSFTLSAYLGGSFGQNDSASFRVMFENVAGIVIGTSTLAGPNSAERGGQTELLPFSSTGFIPVGTRSLLFELDATGVIAPGNSTFNDGYADNLSFVAATATAPTPVPEPASLALLGTGLLGLLRVRRRLKGWLVGFVDG